MALGSIGWLGGALNARAVVTLQLSDASSYSEYGFQASLPGGGTLNANEIIGLYAFSGDMGSPFWTTCLSPGGLLNWDPHTYDQLTFEQAQPGLNPSAWASDGHGALWGIQNAQYLYRTFSPTVLAMQSGSAGARDAGAGLAMAVYEALYDSTGYGQHNNNTFTVTDWGGHDAAEAAYNTYLAALTHFNPATDRANGDVLVPNPTYPGAGQEFILLSPATGPVVPEATTMIAGFGGLSILVLFGFSAFLQGRSRKSAAKV